MDNKGENRPMRDLNSPREPELDEQREGELEEEGEAVGQGRRGTGKFGDENVGEGTPGRTGRSTKTEGKESTPSQEELVGGE